MLCCCCIQQRQPTHPACPALCLHDELHLLLLLLQVFESSRTLGKQGWRFAMQASMLEIYNEDYKDLLARKKQPDGRTHKVHLCSCTALCTALCLRNTLPNGIADC
jgi:hypothetical protein